MNIAIDLTPLQGDHRLRGIGSTLVNVINNVSNADKNVHKFIFFVYATESKNTIDPFEALDLKGMNYEVRHIAPRRVITKRLPGRLGLITSVLNQLIDLRDYAIGDSRMTNLHDVSAFFQIDPGQCLPSSRHVRKYLFIHDLIPYILSDDYLWSYADTRRKGFSRKSAIKHQVRRSLYITKLRWNARRAAIVLCNSDQTRDDANKYTLTPLKKIRVVPLGVTMPSAGVVASPPTRRYVDSSWGYIRRPYTLDKNSPFILFVGGADARRRLDEVVKAFDILRQRGITLKLVLAGDSMIGPDKIDVPRTTQALKDSLYYDDIVFLGFVEQETRNWLYRNASAFIFPSTYEGFGLPVLEAMSYKCPVVSYENAAIKEVAADVTLYVDSVPTLAKAILFCLNLSASERKAIADKGFAQAQKYPWSTTTQRIISLMATDASPS